MRTKIKGKEEYTEMEYKKVNSGGKNQFTNSIIILTSDFTASAAEVFLLLMKELPNVVIIGDKTEGIFSTMYEFTLPNQWEVSLSHEQFFSKSKENYEGQGITPNISVLNSKIDIEHQHDPVIEMAINYLKKRKNQ
jgi:C-terminal processing protease CtpA/Prc